MVYRVGQAASDAEDYAMASKKARQFMRILFGGAMPVQCVTCKSKIFYRKNRLECDCGRRLNRVEYEDDYDDKIIKTIIDIEKKHFTLHALNLDEL